MQIDSVEARRTVLDGEPKSKKSDHGQSRELRSRQKRIGDQLKRMYESVADEPVPDEFLKLLESADDNADKPDN